ncbi:uncharacterized protein LOC106872367 [Octopus bimaculoides]|nr:uncharacterized protein LOC106872367 [Octopus bimaculoides]XP_014774834.2 uncharacterized protein LOC106872367 [Octopus bimaculoides]XP_052832944.1 uncharacterized protein LOC106872367 [Octopus bimaculoides]XP_052832945.1 uncharacterized protein LOC106872367 [Octopus bimaculoides]
MLDLAPQKNKKRSRCFRFCSLLDEDATKPNYKVIFLIFLSLFSSAITLTFIFPFLPEMVRTFGFDEQDKGYYVGIIASSVFAGRALGSYFWGWLSDKKGRKIVLLLTVLGNGVFSLIFGFTSNLPMAIITRFLTGVTNGTVGTAKTILYEISDDTNQALAMSILSLSWGVGLFLGPAFGGFLASPAKKYPNYFDPNGFFGQFPYMLPGAVAFVIAFFVFVVVFLKMPETKSTLLNNSLIIQSENTETEEKKNSDKNPKGSAKNLGRTSSQLLEIEGHHVEAVTGAFLARIQEENSLDQQFGSKSCISLPEELIYGSRDFDTQSAKLSPSRSSHSIVPSRNVSHTNLQLLKNESFSLLPSDIHSKLETGSFTLEIKDISQPNRPQIVVNPPEPKVTDKLMTENNNSNEEPPTKRTNSLCHKLKQSTLITLLSMTDVRMSVALYTIFSFGVIGFEDTFTIWASTEPRLDGLGFSTDQLGVITGIVAVPIMFLQVFIFAPMARRYGILKAFLANVSILFLTVTLCPITHLLYNKPVQLWVSLLILLIPQRICTSCCFSATSLLINNSVTPDIAGSVNGIAMTSTALARTQLPSVEEWDVHQKTSEMFITV